MAAEPADTLQERAEERIGTWAPKSAPTRYGDWEKGGRCIVFLAIFVGPRIFYRPKKRPVISIQVVTWLIRFIGGSASR